MIKSHKCPFSRYCINCSLQRHHLFLLVLFDYSQMECRFWSVLIGEVCSVLEAKRDGRGRYNDGSDVILDFQYCRNYCR